MAKLVLASENKAVQDFLERVEEDLEERKVKTKAAEAAEQQQAFEDRRGRPLAGRRAQLAEHIEELRGPFMVRYSTCVLTYMLSLPLRVYGTLYNNVLPLYRGITP